ncbi:MAG TPA: GNAT family N-acetyltransferase [Actinomycetota bacterium]|nr:GNAT family N-acetyltransferase [Actinomycetota bacterium]
MANRRPEPPIVVRDATDADISPALRLFQSVAAERRWIGREPPVDEDALARRWRDHLTNDNEAFFVADDAGRIVGMATMKWVGASELGMLVADESRGRGIGRALLTACLRWARAANVHKIELKVWPHNEAAIALYGRFGFEREGYLKRHYRRSSGELWDCVVMGLQLPVDGGHDEGGN